MESVWGLYKLCFKVYLGLISLWGTQHCFSLNYEGLSLLEFRRRITSDPFNVLIDWNSNDCNPCNWFGVSCFHNRVETLVLDQLSLEGTLAPELGKLSHLKSLVLYNNKFAGVIPKELGDLTKIELLDLRGNNMTGCIPPEIGPVLLSEQLFVCDKNCRDSNYEEMTKIRKFAYGFKLRKVNAPANEEKWCDNLTSFDEKDINQNLINLVNLRRKLLDQSSNLAAAPFSDGPTIQITPIPITQSSGAFPAFRERQISAQYPSPSTFPFVDQTIPQNSTNGANGRLWKYTIIAAGLAVLFSVVLIMLLIWRKRAAKVIKPWKSGISGELQKAFITGVPKLNLAELETACEDFSNIINSFEGCTIYKGTLSSGVEIAVHSTILTSASYWSKNMEMAYRKKIATLSRLNHKNFTNLIGYCDEEQPFKRMMVFDYDSNGSLFEHLHVKEAEHLDWDTRMRVIMGTVYCLHYMHHDLNPPVAHSNLTSISILLTDDFAAKISEFAFDRRVLHCAAADESHKAELPPHPDPETDVYNFGVLLLEIISGKLPYSEQEGHLVNWAVEHLNDKQSAKNMIDPSLESFKEEDLDVICEVIKACLQSDGRLRPTMMDLTLRLREVLHVSPEQAVPRLSPLWWAELEILSLETT